MKAEKSIGAQLVNNVNLGESFLARTHNPELLVVAGEAVVRTPKAQNGPWVVVFGEQLKLIWSRDNAVVVEVCDLYPRKPSFVVKLFVGEPVPTGDIAAFKYDGRIWNVRKQSDGSVVRSQTTLEYVLSEHPDAAEERYEL